MPSPFPGMDPLLEDHWGDVHTSLTTYARDQIRTQLPPDLRVRVEEYVELTPSEETLIFSYSEPQTFRRVLIHERFGARLVTAIEFLCPGHKLDDRRDQFRQKQRNLAAEGVNLVEIDLIRAGRWAMLPEEINVPESHATPYRIVVVRVTRTWKFECYPAGIRERLPHIRIPLRPDDVDVGLDVQDLVARAWEDGGYSDIDYARVPLPGFEDSDRQWIRDRLAQQGVVRIL